MLKRFYKHDTQNACKNLFAPDTTKEALLLVRGGQVNG